MNAVQKLLQITAGTPELVSYGKIAQLARVEPKTLVDILATCEVKPVLALDGVCFFARADVDGILAAVRALDKVKEKATAN